MNLEDFPVGKFPKYVKVNRSAITGKFMESPEDNGELPPEVQVRINDHPLTNEEFEVLEQPIKDDVETMLSAEDELIQQSENKGLLTKIKNKITQNPHHSAIRRRKEQKALEMKAKELDSATLKRLAEMKEAEEARTKGKEEDQ